MFLTKVSQPPHNKRAYSFLLTWKKLAQKGIEDTTPKTFPLLSETKGGSFQMS
jgi:hypothetical protein